MAAARIVVLGAGFGGLELATLLSEGLAEDAGVTLIDSGDAFVFGYSKLDVLFGLATPDEVRLPYSDFVVDGKTGFLVNTSEEWFDRLSDLIHDEEMRAELGANAKEQAAAWTIEEGWRLWEQAYESVVD